MNDLISVIVPVYNVEKYLDRCMNSIINQTYSNLEIIMVDDGSTDLSGTMCDEWQKRDARIRVIHKKNQGLGLARNSGLQECKGDYIAFIDSDDFVDVNMFEVMLQTMHKQNADTCYCSYNLYSNKDNQIIEKTSINSGCYQGKKVLLDIIGSEPSYPLDCVKGMSVWAALFSNEIIRKHSIQFVSEREYICEDLMFDIKYLPISLNTVVIEECFYNYCINPVSLTHKYYPDRLEKEKKLFYEVSLELDGYYTLNEYQVRYDRLFLGRIRNCIMQEIFDSSLSNDKIKQNIKRIINDSVVQQVIRRYPYQHNPIKQRIFNMCLRYRCFLGVYWLCRMKRK